MKKSRLSLLFFTIFIDLLGFGVVIPILPNYIKTLTGTEHWVGIAVGLFSLLQFFATPLLGGLSDRYGRKPVLLASLALNASGYLLLSQATNLSILLLARALSGFASGNISVAQAYIIDVTVPEKRAKAMGLIGAAFGLGFIFGPPLGGILMSHWGFPAVGYVSGLLCLLNLIPAVFFLKESVVEKNHEAKIKFFAAKDYKQAFKLPVVRSLFIMNFIYIAAFFLFQVCATLFWEEHFGLNEKQRGYTFAFLGICTTAVQFLLIGILSRKFGEQKLLIYSNLSMAAILIGLGLVPNHQFMPYELGLILLMAVANGPVGPSSLTILSQQASPRSQGKTVGLYQSFTSLARVVGPVVGTSLYAIHYLYPFLVGGLLMLLNGYLVIRLRKLLRYSG